MPPTLHKHITGFAKRVLIALTLALLGCSQAALAQVQPAPNDPRRPYRQGDSPDWLRAVGTLIVPGSRREDGYQRHHIERCSATLVGRRTGAPADLIVSAWHCVDYYDDLSKAIAFELSSASGEGTVIDARLLSDGGGINADWAILRLAEPVAASFAPALLPDADTPALDSPLIMAGFSRDPGLGANGSQLTYDPQCRVTARFKHYSDSDCRAHKGASGGAVIALSSNGSPTLAGVISQGDGAGLSRFIPLSAFRSSLRRHLRQSGPY